MSAADPRNMRGRLVRNRAAKPPKIRQQDIVSKHRDVIIEMIRDDGATQDEVVQVLIEDGEPVLEKGFKAEVLKQIGSMDDIRAGKIKRPTAEQAMPACSIDDAPASPAQVPAFDEDDSFTVPRPKR